MHKPGFPVLHIGSRMVVTKEQFIQWVSANESAHYAVPSKYMLFGVAQ